MEKYKEKDNKKYNNINENTKENAYENTKENTYENMKENTKDNIQENMVKDKYKNIKIQSESYNIEKIRRVRILENIEYICKITNISRYTLGQHLRFIHMSLPYLVLLLSIIIPLKFSIIIIIILIIVISLFKYYNGCIMSYIENKLCNDNFNMTHMYLEWNNIEKTHQNSKKLSIRFLKYAVITLVLILIIRYRFNIEFHYTFKY